MTVVLLKDAKDRLEELLTASAQGEEVIIAREDGSNFKLIPEKPAVDTPPTNASSPEMINASAKKKRGLIGSAKG